ncbi:hypothetical protein HYPSUDRAFT_200082 [Hypholoma sublateritium FD-334 SS-4]|uniref:Uncharacterized protein n=1 Tax=Hypholoma sublateritium (strain FD-334 SS-4) TaxID=945553 RepID=A0A0D2Q0Z9_HYPSF|nr:hypothetical protein HYPSUDRAFT_200082 [Hypholoma sublateritium FD-334 SS-4]
MDVSENNNAPSRGQALPKPSDTRAGTQGQVTASAEQVAPRIPLDKSTPASEWSFTQGPYDQRGYYILPQTAVRPANATAQGPSSSQEPNHQLPAASSTRVTALVNTAAGATQPHKHITEFPYVAIYLSIAGPPLLFRHQDGLGSSLAWWASRAKMSAMWLRPSVRAVIWGHPETRQELIRSFSKPEARMSIEEIKRTIFNDVCLILSKESSQDAFWNVVRRLYPYAPHCPYHVSEWAIPCLTCGKEIVGYASDTLWIERYLSHRKNVCEKTLDARPA